MRAPYIYVDNDGVVIALKDAPSRLTRSLSSIERLVSVDRMCCISSINVLRWICSAFSGVSPFTSLFLMVHNDRMCFQFIARSLDFQCSVLNF
jgi:hypothetical protein